MAPPDPTQTPAPDAASVDIPNDRDAIDRFEYGFLDAVRRHGYSKSSVFAIRLAVEEALVNAFKHGHKGLPDSTTVRIEYDAGPSRVLVSVQDQGPGFNPGAVPDPTLDENLECPTGRGLMLIRAYMSDVRYSDDGTRIEMVYTPPQSDGGDDLSGDPSDAD